VVVSDAILGTDELAINAIAPVDVVAEGGDALVAEAVLVASADF
jgi:hypothetical protein